MVFTLEKRSAFELQQVYQAPFSVGTLMAGHSTASATNYVHVDVPHDARPFLPGNEASDLIAAYFALDKLGEVFPGDRLEVYGDGQWIEFLREGRPMSARWGGRNLTPDLKRAIQGKEPLFSSVEYLHVDSTKNPAGHAVDRAKVAYRL